MIKRCGFLVLLLALLDTGCAPRKRVTLIPELEKSDYFAELPHWYRKRRVYHDLDVRFYVEVTYLSQTLLRAYVAEYARAYSLSAEEQKQFYDLQLTEAQAHDTFFISIFAPHKNWDRLDMTDNIWKLRALYLPDGQEVRPIAVEEISYDNPHVSYFYPYSEPWARHFKVVVEALPQAKEVQFSMQGVVGSQEFQWERR